MSKNSHLYDVILMDSAWRLRGALPYETMSDSEILAAPLKMLQENGFLFQWYVNEKKEVAAALMAKHGYKVAPEWAWVKLTTTGKLYSGRGYWAQNCMENIMVGTKGNVTGIVERMRAQNVIIEKVGKHSVKP